MIQDEKNTNTLKREEKVEVIKIGGLSGCGAKRQLLLFIRCFDLVRITYNIETVRISNQTRPFYLVLFNQATS